MPSLDSLAPCSRCRRGPSDGAAFYSAGEGLRDRWCAECRKAYMRARGGGPARPAPCAHCGVAFEVVGDSRKRFCGSACAAAARAASRAAGRRQRESLVERCRICDAEFSPFEPNHGRKKFCSRVCLEQGTRARKYGLSPEDYRKLRNRAGGACEMCGVAFEHATGFSPHAPRADLYSIDHCHETGAVRGLLCAGCNAYLGHFEKVRSNAERYLAFAALDLRDLCLR